MMNIQDFIVEATKRISAEHFKRANFTKSHVGRVESIDDTGGAVALINNASIKCILPVNMLRYVAVGDIVVVQDLHNNRSYMVIHGVIKGSGKGIGGNIIVHIYDIENNNVVSSAMQVWDESKNSIVSTTFKIE